MSDIVTVSTTESVVVVAPCSALPAGDGTGDMLVSVYDPTGVSDDAFDLANMVGNLDGGTFN